MRLVWPGKGLWKPKAGHVYVTWYVKVKALEQTTIGGMYYSLRSTSGEWYSGSVTAAESPGSRSRRAWLRAGRRRAG